MPNGGDRQPHKTHYPVGQHVDERHQKNDGNIPDLSCDPLIIEGSPQELPHPKKLLLPVHKDQGSYRRGKVAAMSVTGRLSKGSLIGKMILSTQKGMERA